METFVEKFVLFLFAVVVSVVLSLLLAWPVQLLWNEVMPELFGLKSITFWQALMLLLLSGFLFRSGSSSKSND